MSAKWILTIRISGHHVLWKKGGGKLNENWKKEQEAFLEKWKADGNKTTFYTCAHCQSKIETLQPMESSYPPAKGFWHTLKLCPECDRFCFVWVYPNGDTKAQPKTYENNPPE